MASPRKPSGWYRPLPSSWRSPRAFIAGGAHTGGSSASTVSSGDDGISTAWTSSRPVPRYPKTAVVKGRITLCHPSLRNDTICTGGQTAGFRRHSFSRPSRTYQSLSGINNLMRESTPCFAFLPPSIFSVSLSAIHLMLCSFSFFILIFLQLLFAPFLYSSVLFFLTLSPGARPTDAPYPLEILRLENPAGGSKEPTKSTIP